MKWFQPKDGEWEAHAGPFILRVFSGDAWRVETQIDVYGGFPGQSDNEMKLAAEEYLQQLLKTIKL